jgi:hypothetical protein
MGKCGLGSWRGPSFFIYHPSTACNITPIIFTIAFLRVLRELRALRDEK